MQKQISSANNITIGGALKYALLPGILPRIGYLWRSGFGTLALYIAILFYAVRLLPVGHPYLKQSNVGSFGILNVILAAKANLIFSRKHIDQIIVFLLINVAFLTLILQIISFIFAILMPGVFAQGFFSTPNPTNDIAFVLLDRIFGVPLPVGGGGVIGFFQSCVGDTANDCTAMRYDGTNSALETVYVPAGFPWGFHLALHQLFAFYSYIILVISLFILLYLIMSVVLETIESGTPFGKRFAKLWAPLRLMMAFALVVPLSTGLNLGQYGVLYAAKWGSSMATNIWQNFNTNLTAAGVIEVNSMVASPKGQDIPDLLAFIHAANLCWFIERNIYPRKNVSHEKYSKEIDAYIVNPSTNTRQPLIDSSDALTTYNTANNIARKQDMLIVIGSQDPVKYPAAILPAGFPPQDAGYGIYPAYIKPYCGKIVIPAINEGSAGARMFREQLYYLIAALWTNDPSFLSLPACPNTSTTNAALTSQLGIDIWNYAAVEFGNHFLVNMSVGTTPTRSFEKLKIDGAIILREYMNCIIEAAVEAERADIAANNSHLMPPELLDRGWAGAGIWYNRIADINGALIASLKPPRIESWPETMRKVAAIRSRNDFNPIRKDIYNPNAPAFKNGIILPRHSEKEAAELYYQAYERWNSDGPGTGGREVSGNFFESAIAWIFGVEGLFSMLDNTDGAINVHPLAKLSALGKSMIESSIRNLSLGAFGMIGDLTTGANNPLSAMGDFAGAMATALVSASSITLTAGFILFYIVPLLPFMYFFFAVGTWVKTIFEAMVGVPIWALSHLHIDSNGLPGQSASNGYYLLFEIFVRPVIIIMAFIASITVFSAMANVLIDVWVVVIANVGGVGATEESNLTDMIRGPVDKIFYLIMFTMLLYMIGVSSFKLVDQVPQSILRWVGASVPTFVDNKDDVTSTLVSRTAMAGTQIFGRFTQGITGKYQQVKNAQEKQQNKVDMQKAKEIHQKPEARWSAEEREFMARRSDLREALDKDLVTQTVKDPNPPAHIKSLRDKYRTHYEFVQKLNE